MVPTSIDELSVAWLATHLGDIEVEDVERVGEAHGFVSSVARVRGAAEGGPFDLVVKLTEARRVEREAWFLGRVAPLVAMALPRLWFAEVDEHGRGALAMDHVPGAQGDVLVAVPPAVVESLLTQLARLHQRFAGVDDPVVDPVREVEPPRFLVRPERLDALREHRRDLVDPVASASLERVADEAAAAWEHLLAGPRTLVHGDVHLDNVVLGEDGPVLLDWEAARPGTAAEDLAHVAVARMLGPARRDTIPFVTDSYRRAVEASGGTCDDELDARVRSGLVALAAGTINWAGRVAVDRPADARHRAVGDDALEQVLRIVAMLDGDPV